MKILNLSDASESEIKHEILRQRQEIQRLIAEASQLHAHTIKMAAEIRILREKLDELPAD